MTYHWHICPPPPEYRITVRGRIIAFEDHPYCGPMPITAKGMGMDLAASHPFWHAVTQWYQKGKQVGPNNTCIWDYDVPAAPAAQPNAEGGKR